MEECTPIGFFLRTDKWLKSLQQKFKVVNRTSLTLVRMVAFTYVAWYLAPSLSSSLGQTTEETKRDRKDAKEDDSLLLLLSNHEDLIAGIAVTMRDSGLTMG
jgi:hypothetical protein